MVERQFNFGAWVFSLGPLAPNWCLGWTTVGGFQLINVPESDHLRIQHQQGNAWRDVYLGEAQEQPQTRRSILDPRAKVAIHYLHRDSGRIRRLECPAEVPTQLWQQLQARLANGY